MSEKIYHRADILFGKCENIAANVEAVQFHGIKRTKSDALVKEVAYLYRSSTLSELLHNVHLAASHLQEIGLMDSATPLIDTADDDPNKYIVNFVVKEPRSFSVEAKAGITTRGDADISLMAQQPSFNGRGENISASYSHSVKGDQSFYLSFFKPFLGWQKYSNISLAAYRSLAYLPWIKVNIEENGMVAQYNGQLWNRKLLHAVKLNTIWRKMSPTDATSFSVREYAGHSMKCSLENTLAYDTRDRALLATRGLLLRLSQEYAGSLGDASFVKHQFDAQAAAPLILGAILSASFRFATLHALNNRSIHVLDRIYLGGPHDVRGFDLNTIGPRDGASCLGGAASYCAAVHIYRPLVPANMLYAHIFASNGAVASVTSNNRFEYMRDAQRITGGIGLSFVFRNIVRLELNYVFPLRFVPGDLCSTGVQFGAGINFL
ncbi:hypothetical protein AB6A40_007056 [Gnathostoma spinigerum]|uniref:Bacterial surface antigen (D15) domain-containing protein n=1 Tax=Gnathostoma spinigerum TaxID=75299 RepID=A0ABD6EUU9_9BILA